MTQKDNNASVNTPGQTTIINFDETRTPPQPPETDEEIIHNAFLQGILNLLSAFFSRLATAISNVATPPVAKQEVSQQKPQLQSKKRSFFRTKLGIILLLILEGGVLWIGYTLHPSAAAQAIGLIRHATIEAAYVKSDPNPPFGFPFLARGLYFCDVQYPGDNNQMVSEVLKDIDEGAKNNSADVFQMCIKYALNSNTPSFSGKPVTLIVSGQRDPQVSSFRNIISFLPD